MYLIRHPRLYDLIKRATRRLGRTTLLYELLDEQLGTSRPFSFLQLGANDGITNDPYREFMIRPNARGVAVEPVPDYFDKLAQNYVRYPRVRLENSAVGYPGGKVPFYAYTDEYIRSRGNWSDLVGMAGFSRKKLVDALEEGDDAEISIRNLMIPVLTVEEILERHGLDGVDCLFLDCEGHEQNILTGMDYSRVKPRLIAYEHTHFSDKPVHEKILSELGFTIHRFKYDAVAIRPDDSF